MADVNFDVIIIGAGPAGSTAAILLARAGWRVAVIEKSDFPRRKVCGECIAPSNLPLFDAIGIGQAVRSLAGPPLRRMALMADEQIIHADFPPYKGVDSWGVALSREHLDTLLLDQAKAFGTSVLQPWAATTLKSGLGGHRCTVKKLHSFDTMILTAPILIDAHGSWETAATATPDRGRVGKAGGSDFFAFKANFKHGGLDRGLLPVISFPGGYGGMVVGGHATTTLAFCIRRDTLENCRRGKAGTKAAEAAAIHVAQSCLGVRTMLESAEQHGTWLAAGPLRPGIHPSSQAPGLFVIGNAAGEAHPIIGEGMSMAIQSAVLLADLLSPCIDQRNDAVFLHALQGQYNSAWRKHFASRIHLAAVFAHVAMRPRLLSKILPMLTRHPHLLTHAARWSGKVRDAPMKIAPMG